MIEDTNKHTIDSTRTCVSACGARATANLKGGWYREPPPRVRGLRRACHAQVLHRQASTRQFQFFPYLPEKIGEAQSSRRDLARFRSPALLQNAGYRREVRQKTEATHFRQAIFHTAANAVSLYHHAA